MIKDLRIYINVGDHALKNSSAYAIKTWEYIEMEWNERIDKASAFLGASHIHYISLQVCLMIIAFMLN